jgi:hypothetical protein
LGVVADDSDLNQYLEVPALTGVVPLSDGAFSYAWAGTRGSHGVEAGRVCYEVTHFSSYYLFWTYYLFLFPMRVYVR